MTKFLCDNSRPVFLIMAIFLMGLTGCVSTNLPTPNPTSSPTYVPTNSPEPSPTNPPAPTSANSPTLTPAPTNSPLPSPTSSPTPNPLIVDFSERLPLLLSLMEPNQNCPLPCWLTIQVNKTTLPELKEASFTLSSGQKISLEEIFNSVFSGEFTANEEGFIQTIDFQGAYLLDSEDDRLRFEQTWGNYSANRVLNELGIPSQIVVFAPYRPDMDSPPGYRLVLFFESQGVAIEYAGIAKELPENKNVACVENFSYIHLFIYQPAEELNVMAYMLPLSTLRFAETEADYELIKLENQTQFSTPEQFYQFYTSDEGDKCFEFRRDVQP